MHGAESTLEDREGLLEQVNRLVVVTHVGEDRRQRRAIGRGGGMVIAERGRADAQGAAGRSLTLGGPATGVREAADVVHDHADVGVRWTEPGDEDGVSVVIQPSGFCECACVLENDAEVIAAPGRGEVVGGQAMLGDGQGLSVRPLGAPRVAGSAAKRAEPAQASDSPPRELRDHRETCVSLQLLPPRASAEAAGT